jgi:hypothetical protein
MATHLRSGGAAYPGSRDRPAADTPVATVAYRPGDTVRIFITFKEPVSLKNAMVRFNLQSALPERQKVFTSLFDANVLALRMSAASHGHSRGLFDLADQCCLQCITSRQRGSQPSSIPIFREERRLPARQ